MRSLIILLPLAVAAVPALAAETVPVPAFQSVELRGGGDIVYRHGPVQRVKLISGSTQFTGFHVDRQRKLAIDACNNRCPQHYDLRIEIESPTIPDSAVEGGGSIMAAPGFGQQADVAVAVDGGGEIDLRSVRIADVAASVDGGGKITIGPSANLAAAVNGGGEVRYAGNPQVTTAINGGGAVRRLN
jgi:hypothetical protein